MGPVTNTYDETGYAERLRQAADRSTPSWRLAALAEDPEPEVRLAVAINPSSSSLTVLRLRRDLDIRVRTGAMESDGITA